MEMLNITNEMKRAAEARFAAEESAVDAFEYVYSRCAGILTCTVQIVGDRPNPPVEIGAVYLWVNNAWHSVVLN